MAGAIFEMNSKFRDIELMLLIVEQDVNRALQIADDAYVWKMAQMAWKVLLYKYWQTQRSQNIIGIFEHSCPQYFPRRGVRR